jgi:hypothetical protein
MCWNELVLVGLRVEIKQMVLLRIHLAALVELAAIDAYIVVLGCHRSEDEFEGFRLNVVDLAEGFEKDEGNGSRRRETSDGKAAFDDSAQTIGEGISLAKFECGASKIVCPVVTFLARHIANMELGPFVELERAKFHYAIMLGTVGEMDAFVDCQPCDFPQVSIAMGSDGAYSIGAESKGFRFALVDLLESFLAFHDTIDFVCFPATAVTIANVTLVNCKRHTSKSQSSH